MILGRNSLLFVLAGVCLWSALLAWRGSPVFTLRTDMSDHVSNIYVSLPFWKDGLTIYREGPESYLDHDMSEPSQAMAKHFNIASDDVMKFRDGDGPHPLLIVWPWMPRPYPMGSTFFFSPLGAMIRAGAPPAVVFALCTVLFLIVAHVTFLQVIGVLKKDLTTSPSRWRWLLFALIGLFVYQELTVWAVNGIYDGLSLIFLLLSATTLVARRWLFCIFFFCLSFFIHYRALFWGLIPVLALINGIKDGSLREDLRTVKNQTLFVVAGTMALISLWTFALTWGSLNRDYQQMKNNPFYWSSISTLPSLELGGWFLLLTGWTWFALKNKLSFFWLNTMWLTFMLLRMPFVKSWYILFMLPLLFFPLAKDITKATATRIWGLALYSYLGGCVFVNSPFEFYLWKESLKNLF